MAKSEIRPIRVEGQVAYVPLTQGYTAIIDAADVHLVEGFNWCADVHRGPDGTVKVVYAARLSPRGADGKQRMIMLHRSIMDADPSMMVDHISGDGLDNRRINMRCASRAQNAHNARLSRHNTSGYKGVDASANAWRARIAVNGRRIELGRFGCPTAAAIAYAKASHEMHGKFGRVA